MRGSQGEGNFVKKIPRKLCLSSMSHIKNFLVDPCEFVLPLVHGSPRIYIYYTKLKLKIGIMICSLDF